jgi:glutathione peroxidase-family protein
MFEKINVKGPDPQENVIDRYAPTTAPKKLEGKIVELIKKT